MLYKLFYELDNGCTFADVCSVVFSEHKLNNEDDVKVFLHKFVHKASDDYVRRVYKIEPLTYTGKNELILQKVKY